jgi:hypothetical protein
MAFVELVGSRGKSHVVYRDDATGVNRFVQFAGTRIHRSDGARADMTASRRNDGVLDGWEVIGADWHFRIGTPAGKATDGWIGYGGRGGERWIYSRLVRFAYVHWPTRSVQAIGGAPSFLRGKLSSSSEVVDLGIPGESVVAGHVVEWRDMWNTPGAGEVWARWVADGKGLKEEVVVNAAARAWIQANIPPATNPVDTYLCMIFEMDLPAGGRLVKGFTDQDLDGDFEDDGGPLDVRNTNGDFLGFMPSDFAYSGDRMSRVPLRKRIWKDGDGHRYMAVGAKVEDLAGLSGDLIFDPTYTSQPDATAGVDVLLLKSSPTTNFGTWQGNDLDDGASESRCLIKFDLTSIPSGSGITSAVLNLTTRAVSSGAVSCHVASVKSANSSWTESGARWNNTNGSTSWAGSAGCSTSGTDFESTDIGSWTSTSSAGGGTVETISISTSTISDIVNNPSNNYGLLIYATGTFGSVVYASSDHATAGWRPKLTVDYTSGGPAPFFISRTHSGGFPVGVN